jgi:mono/diheme cytochrome c family protein
VSTLGLVPAVLLPPVAGYSQGTVTPGLIAYRRHCATCHGPDPAQLARRSLRFDGPVVLVVQSGTPLGEFLQRHGRSDASERQNLVALFESLLSQRRNP